MTDSNNATPAAAVADHTDAELLRAWNDYVAAEKALTNMSFNNMTINEERESWIPSGNALKKIDTLPASTSAGIAIHLRIAFADLYQDDGNTYKAMVHDYVPTTSEREKWPTPKQTLWNLIQVMERQALTAQTVQPAQGVRHG